MRLSRLVIALALALTIQLVSAPGANAATCGSFANRFTGYYHNPDVWPTQDFKGSSGYGVVRTGVLCSGNTGSGNFTNAWVMIAAWDGYGWSQVGWERTYGYPYRWFSQHNGDGTLATRYSTFPVDSEIGVRHTFRVLWSSSCASNPCVKAYIDTTLWSSSFFNPFDLASDWGPRPFSPQFSGEVGFAQSGVTGTPAAHTILSSLGAQRFSDGLVIPMTCTMNATNNNPADWALTAPACDNIQFWTK